MDHLLTKRITDTMHTRQKCTRMQVMMLTLKKRTMHMAKMRMLSMVMHTQMHTALRHTMHMLSTYTTNNKTAHGVPYT
jgi:hypothetical protein